MSDAPTPESSSHGKLPPATLTSLISVLATQAMIALGQIADPVSGKPAQDLEQASHFVDLLSMLEEKTKGNRTGDESALLDRVLHELRMVFVAVKQSPS